MQLRMQNAEGLTSEQIGEFLKGSGTIEFQGQNRADLYGCVQRVLVAQEYARQSRKQRGMVRAYIVKVTGLSLPQTTRLIRKYRAEGVVEADRRRAEPWSWDDRQTLLRFLYSIRLLRVVTTEARIPAGTANSDICRSWGEIWICATTGSRDCRSPPAFRYRPRSRMLHVAASPDRIQTSSCGSPTGKAGVQMADGNCTPGC
jgi:hypothetical protein